MDGSNFHKFTGSYLLWRELFPRGGQEPMLIDETLKHLMIRDIDLSDLVISRTQVIECDFSAVNLSKGRIWESQFALCRFLSVDLTKAEIASSFTDSTFEECGFGQSKVIGANFSRCTFTRCDLSFTVLMETKFSECTFVESNHEIPLEAFSADRRQAGP